MKIKETDCKNTSIEISTSILKLSKLIATDPNINGNIMNNEYL